MPPAFRFLLVTIFLSAASTEVAAQRISDLRPSDHCEFFAALTIRRDCEQRSIRVAAAPLIEKRSFVQTQDWEISGPAPVLLSISERRDANGLITWSGPAALLISIVTAVLGQRQVRRARERSIRDEFWVRQVVYPQVLRPCLDFIEWCADNLPPPPNAGLDADAVANFRHQFRARFREARVKITILGALKGPVDNSWYCRVPASLSHNSAVDNPNDRARIVQAHFSDCIETIEETVMVYLAELSDMAVTEADHQRSASAIQAETPNLIEALVQWQHDM